MQVFQDGKSRLNVIYFIRFPQRHMISQRSINYERPLTVVSVDFS